MTINTRFMGTTQKASKRQTAAVGACQRANRVRLSSSTAAAGNCYGA